MQIAFDLDDGAVAFCICIDGLDEFAEDQSKLITELIVLHAEKPNVKFCVSSRTYNAFSAAFCRDATRTLALQDVNAGDTDIFVRGSLEQDQRFQDLAQ